MTNEVQVIEEVCAKVDAEAQARTVEHTLEEPTDQASSEHTVELHFSDEEVASESNRPARAQAEDIPLPRGLTQEVNRVTARVTLAMN